MEPSTVDRPKHLSRRADAPKLSLRQNAHAVGQPARLGQVVRRHGDRRLAQPNDAHQHLLHAQDGFGVNIGGWLIEQQDFGLAQEGAGDGQSLRLAPESDSAFRPA